MLSLPAKLTELILFNTNQPTHNDMQAIDPDYYKNLQMILQHNLLHVLQVVCAAQPKWYRETGGVS